MKALYHLSTNTLEQLPSMEKPERPELMDYSSSADYVDACSLHSQECMVYNAHIASLRTDIPCDPSCREIWADKQVVEEEKEYSIFHRDKGCNCGNYFNAYDDKKGCWNCDTTIWEAIAVPLLRDSFHDSINSMADDSKIFVDKSMGIANKIAGILDRKGMKQKDLADLLGKTEPEISRLLAGMHNVTLRTISKLEAVLGEEILAVPLTPPVQEDNLWYQVKDLMIAAIDKNLSPEEWVSMMKGLYHLTKKQ